MRTLVWFALVVVAIWCAGCSGSPDPNSLVERYVDLHRSGNIDGLLALHTADAEFLIPGQEPVRGTSALRDLLEWDAVLGSELVLDSIAVDADTIRIHSAVERNKWFKGLGLSEVHFNPGMRFVLQGGHIKGTYLTDFEDQTQQLVFERFGLLTQWLSANRPDALEQLLPGGKFQYNAASARQWLEVFEEWNHTEH